MNKGNILISIITVVYNGEKHLEQTIQSVLNQTYPSVEYILIDGGSKDGTLDIIKKYDDKIAYWISEKDNGIYDAMNKGILAATGEWINFMNAGDTFANEDTIEKVFSKSKYDDTDIIFGNSIIKFLNNDVLRVTTSGEIEQLAYAPIYRHGASFVRSSVHKSNLFDLSQKKFGYALDFYCINTLYFKNYQFQKIEEDILVYLNDGVSNHPLKNNYYNFIISIENKFTFKAVAIFIKRILVWSILSIKRSLIKSVKTIFFS
ncbi:glycosyltransferase family 2 protein [uncultured Draconibacterium sp.]|uniref:glycosyltransferase family 2 protein n=1 Tax=uncultured Draconibacterium sp. TaxID=1573823 RepID=UPI00321663BC